MSSLSEQATLLEELNDRQDEVLRELDRLNQRIESLLEECLRKEGRHAAVEGKTQPGGGPGRMKDEGSVEEGKTPPGG
jgi:hypothetical protein